MAEEAFLNNLEILDILARDFVYVNADFLAGTVSCNSWAGGSESVLRNDRTTPTDASHSPPSIVKALQCIETHISDPKLTVSRVACELGLNANYLSGLFVDLVGQGMKGFIANRRVEMAKALLATTDWQIKRIAHDTGHANPRWFCHVFRTTTGASPGAYRARSRRSSRVA